MRRTHRVTRFAVTLGLAALVTSAAAQELKIRQMRMQSDGQLVWSAGATISKGGVSIPFDSHMVDKKFVGFKLESAATETLKPGDLVLLYFPGLKVTGDHPKDRRDATGAKVFANSDGAWRAVTIESVSRAGARVVISFKEELTLNNGQKIKRLESRTVDGFLLPEMIAPTAK